MDGIKPFPHLPIHLKRNSKREYEVDFPSQLDLHPLMARAVNHGIVDRLSSVYGDEFEKSGMIFVPIESILMGKNMECFRFNLMRDPGMEGLYDRVRGRDYTKNRRSDVSLKFSKPDASEIARTIHFLSDYFSGLKWAVLGIENALKEMNYKEERQMVLI